MEPRARAGKNAGKMNFNQTDMMHLLYAHGDVRAPLPETARVLDEILTDFIQGVSFEASRSAHYAGRQKLKFEDFEFAFRKNPVYLGKVREVFEKKGEIEKAKKMFDEHDGGVVNDSSALAAVATAAAAADGEGEGTKKGKGGKSAKGANGAAAEEELGEQDDVDEEVTNTSLGRKK